MKLRRFPVLAGIALVGLGLASCAPRLAPAGWVRLAIQEVPFAVSRAVLRIPPSAPAVSRLLIAARVNSVEITQVRVFFENGTDFEQPGRTKLEVDRDTLTFDLPGDRRRVREVVLRYLRITRGARRAAIEVWGDPR